MIANQSIGGVTAVVMNEAARLDALAQRQILDTPPEPEFDELAALAASVCGTPMAIITLIDEKRQWFKSQFGLTISQTPREIAFCNTTIQQRGLTVVEDAFRDPRFADNPLVHSNVGIRFYAGVPLITRDGHAIGTLAVLDTIPRRLLDSQRDALSTLGRNVMSQIELRRSLIAAQNIAQAGGAAGHRDALADAITATLEQPGASRSATDLLPGLFFYTDESGKVLRCNRAAAKLVDFFGAGVSMLDLVANEVRPAFLENQQKAIEWSGETFETIFVDPEKGRLPYLVAVKRELLDGVSHLFWLALPLSELASS